MGFLMLGSLFFLLVGRPPLAAFAAMIKGAFGDGYSLSETLVKTAPILLCATAAALPARLGLVSVGGEGQFYLGAMAGTALVLAFPHAPAWALMPGMLLAACAGGAMWALIPGFLKARLGVNETIVTLLLNYVASLLADFLVYGPWKDPDNLGWPATLPFPAAARLPSFFGTRAHIGIVIGVAAALVLHSLTARTRWGMSLRLLRSNRKVAEGIGLRFGRQAILVVCLGGMLAGMAGICETSAIQGRLQPGISNGMGFSGFLAAWMAGQDFLRILPLALLLGGLLASADSLQMFAGLPSSAALVLQGLLFACVLAAGRLRKGGA
jgi:simple sugar transport system permease protein